MRGQVIRGGQTDNPGDMPLQLRRFAERQASVFQRLRPREQGFAIVGQAVAALMAAEERNVQRLLQPIQPAGDRGNPHVHLVGGAAQRSRPGDGEEYASIIPVKFCGHLFSIYGKTALRFPLFFINFAGMILHAIRGDNQAIWSPALSSPERPCTARNAPFLRIRLI